MLSVGCNPRCQQVCSKVRRCDVSPRLAQTECIESCLRQEEYYQSEGDEYRYELYVAHKRCIKNSSCDEINDGECYEEDIFIF